MASDGQSFAHFKQRVHEARLITGIGGSKFINAKLEKNVNLIQASHYLIDCFADKNKIPTDFKISEDL